MQDRERFREVAAKLAKDPEWSAACEALHAALEAQNAKFDALRVLIANLPKGTGQ